MRYECRANYELVNENEDSVIIKDIGPWDKYQTITNGAEGVVEELSTSNRLLSPLGNRHIYYIDSAGITDELVHSGDGRFIGFKSCKGHNPNW